MTLADYETTAGMSVNGLVNVRNCVRRENYVTMYYHSRCFILFSLGDKENMSETRIHSTCLEFINHSWASMRTIKEEDNQAPRKLAKITASTEQNKQSSRPKRNTSHEKNIRFSYASQLLKASVKGVNIIYYEWPILDLDLERTASPTNLRS